MAFSMARPLVAARRSLEQCLKIATNGTLATLISFDGTTSRGGTNDSGTICWLILTAPPASQAVSQTRNTLTLTWSAVAGQKYQLQSTGDWGQKNRSNLCCVLTATGASLSATNAIGPHQRRFYRAVLLL